MFHTQLDQPLLRNAHSVTQPLYELFHQWWVRSRSTSFLQSKLSRRHLGKYLICFVGMMALVGDLQQHSWYDVIADVAITVAYIIISRITTVKSLKLDAVFAAVYVLVVLGADTADMWNPTSSSNVFLDLGAISGLMIFCGMHSCCMALPIFAVCAKCPSIAVCQLASCLLFIGITIEYITSLAHDIQTSHINLLEHGADGFCTVSIESGQIVTASANLRSCFSGMQLIGESVTDFLSTADRSKFQTLLDSACSDRFMCELVTVELPTQGNVFDCRVASYSYVGTSISLCFFRQGEVRTLTTQVNAFAREFEAPLGASIDEGGVQSHVHLDWSMPVESESKQSHEESWCALQQGFSGSDAGSQSSKLSKPGSVAEACRQLFGPLQYERPRVMFCTSRMDDLIVCAAEAARLKFAAELDQLEHQLVEAEWNRRRLAHEAHILLTTCSVDSDSVLHSRVCRNLIVEAFGAATPPEPRPDPPFVLSDQDRWNTAAYRFLNLHID